MSRINRGPPQWRNTANANQRRDLVNSEKCVINVWERVGRGGMRRRCRGDTPDPASGVPSPGLRLSPTELPPYTEDTASQIDEPAIPGELVTTSSEPFALETSDPQDPAARLDGISLLIGNTPMLAVDCDLDGSPRTIYAKLESMNWTGSVKDRMALHIFRRAYRSGALRPGALVVEATSGNTGISFAAIGRAFGHHQMQQIGH